MSDTTAAATTAEVPVQIDTSVGKVKKAKGTKKAKTDKSVVITEAVPLVDKTQAEANATTSATPEEVKQTPPEVVEQAIQDPAAVPLVSEPTTNIADQQMTSPMEIDTTSSKEPIGDSTKPQIHPVIARTRLLIQAMRQKKADLMKQAQIQGKGITISDKVPIAQSSRAIAGTGTSAQVRAAAQQAPAKFRNMDGTRLFRRFLK